MAIYRLLQNSPLGPDQIAVVMAYKETLCALRLKDRYDPVTQLIARKVFEVGQTGLKDAAQISARAIEELGCQ